MLRKKVGEKRPLVGFLPFYRKDATHMRHRLQMLKETKPPLGEELPLVRLFRHSIFETIPISMLRKVEGKQPLVGFLPFHPKDTTHMRHRLQIHKKTKSPLEKEPPLVRLFFHSIFETVLICAVGCRSRSGDLDAFQIA